jgi:hypothetical protein
MKNIFSTPKILMKLAFTNLNNVLKLFLYRIGWLNAFLRYIASPKLHDMGLVDRLHR